MRLDYLKIHDFKNLVDFAVDFEETCNEPVTVVLGRAGSGKSNLYEALVIIFRDLLKGKRTKEFGYDLRYTLRNGKVAVRVWNPPGQRDEEDKFPLAATYLQRGEGYRLILIHNYRGRRRTADGEGEDSRLFATLCGDILLGHEQPAGVSLLQTSIGVS